MELLLAKKYWMYVFLKKDKSVSTQITLTVFVESRSGRLNTETGSVIPINELDEAVNDAISDVTGKNIDEIKGLAYLPHTLEMMSIRLWEKIDESLNYKARLAKLRLTKEPDFFVEYIGRESVPERKTKKKPQVEER